MKKPLISVLMSTYNEPIEYIIDSINSILAQTYENFEFVIINDNPIRVDLDEYLNKLYILDRRIKIIKNESNIGLTASLNKGLRYCSGLYIARMDADDISEPFRLEKELEYIIKQDLDIVGAYIQPISPTGENYGKSKKYPVWNGGCRRYLKSRSSLIHPTWLVKREVYEVLDGYRNVKYCEDYDFLIRASKIYKLACCPWICLRYRINPNGISVSNKITQKVYSKYLRKNFNRINELTPHDADFFYSKSAGYISQMEYYFNEIEFIRTCVSNCRKVLEYFRIFFGLKFARESLIEVLRMKMIMFISNCIEKARK